MAKILMNTLGVFTKADATFFQSQRMAGQYGTLMARAGYLTCENLPTRDAALDMLQSCE